MLDKEGVVYITPKQFVLTTYVPAKDSFLEELISKRKEKAGLDNVDITLILPEHKDFDETSILGSVQRNNAGGYYMDLCPKAIERSYTIEYAIDHELAHIKFGDADKEFKGFFGRVFFRLYMELIGEPRAHIYATARSIFG